jgi:hypothetical protein
MLTQSFENAKIKVNFQKKLHIFYFRKIYAVE